MIKRPKISKHEIIADLIFIFIGMFVAFTAIFIFDIHWSFYPGNTIFPPNKHIFQTPTPYLIGIPLGGLIGFIVIKLLFYAFMEEEEAVGEARWKGWRNGTKKKKPE
ncbi:MAG: hypothetical protein WCT31_02595 [Candidatus Micrarchaeia archaeon]